ncbi:ATP synthase subunit I [Hydrogenophaga soli]
MNTIDQVSRKPCTKLNANPGNGVDGVETEDEDNNFKPLTAQEAEEWRLRQRTVSIWRVLGWQLLVGVSVGFLWWGLSGRLVGALSVWYGAGAVWFPAVLMAWGLTAGRLSKALSVFPKGSLAAVMFWEGVKVLLSVMLMALAPKLLVQVDWLALLAGLVAVIKVNWLALWGLSRSTAN